MNLRLKPFKQASEEWSVSTWPQKKDLPNLMASVTYVLPAGERQTVQATPVLTAEEMYSRETILDDLL
jgi:hypothetical protein